MISKSDLRLFLDSPRHLWANFHGRWHPETSDFTKKTAEDGYRVEKLATEFLKNYIITNNQRFEDDKHFVRP